MAKDPFEIPALPNEDQAALQKSVNLDTSKDVTKGATSKKLLSNLQKFAIPVMVIGLLVWVLLPNTGPRNKTTKREIAINEAEQAANTNGMLDYVKEDAKNKAASAASQASAAATQNDAVNLTSNPVAGNPKSTHETSSTGAVAPVYHPATVPGYPSPAGGPIPNGVPGMGSVGLPADDPAYSAQKREEEIRAAGLEANEVKLMQPRTVAHDIPSSARNLQDQIAAAQAEHQAAMSTETDRQSKLLDALKPLPPENKGTPSEEFLAKQDETSKINQVTKQQATASDTLIQQGTVIRSVLLTGVSSDQPGMVTALVTSDVYDSIHSRQVLIPKGSKLNGHYNSSVIVGQETILLAMNRLILPNGTWVSLSGAPATNMLGQSGLEADVNNHFFKMFGASLIIGTASAFLPNSQNQVTSSSTPTGTQTGGSVLAMSLNDTVTSILQRNKNIQPTLTVQPGQPFLFLVSNDLIMSPYRR